LGLSCGNLTNASFGVDSEGRVHFRGFLGGYPERISADFPIEARPFFEAQSKSLGKPSKRVDVSSLAVIGLQLFGAEMAPVFFDSKSARSDLKSVIAGSPPWVLAVLSTLLHTKGRDVCCNAEQIVDFIYPGDAQYVRSKRREAIGKDGDINVKEGPLSIGEIRDMYLSSQELYGRRIEGVVNTPQFKLLLLAIIFFIAAPFFLKIFRIASQYIATEKTLIDNRRADAPAANEIISSIVGISQLGVDNQPGEGSGSFKKELDALLAKRNMMIEGGALNEASPNLPNVQIQVSEDNLIFRTISSGSLPLKDAEAVLDLYQELDPSSRVLVFKAFNSTSGELRELYAERLRELAPGSDLITKEIIGQLSLGALFLLNEDSLSEDNFKILREIAAINRGEVGILSEFHARRRSKVFRYIASVLLEGPEFSGIRGIYLNLAAQSSENSGAPFHSLLSAARGEITLSELESFNRWPDPLSQTALYAALLSSTQQELRSRAITMLGSRSDLEPGVREIIDIKRDLTILNSEQLFNLVAAIGLGPIAPQKLLENALAALKDERVFRLVTKALFRNGSEWVVLQILRSFGDRYYPETLVSLLERPEKGIRMEVVQFLKPVVLSSSRALIKEHLERERDPELRNLLSELVAGW
jgi:hypothetical protein